MSDMLAMLEKRLKASQQAHPRAAESTAVKKRKAPEEDGLADAAAGDVVMGASVFGQRGDGHAEAIVRGPSKKADHWALKFSSDGKVLPRRLEQIKVRNSSSTETNTKQRKAPRSGNKVEAAQMCKICKKSFVCGDKLIRCGNGNDKGCHKGFHRSCVGLKAMAAEIPQVPKDPKQAIIAAKKMKPIEKKQILKSIGLSIQGNRKDLQDRLLAAVADGANRAPANWYCTKCEEGEEDEGDMQEAAAKVAKAAAPPTDIQTLKHMKTVVWNILNKEDPKYRKVWVTNDDRFCKTIAKSKDAIAFLKGLGFVAEGETVVMKDLCEAPEFLQLPNELGAHRITLGKGMDAIVAAIDKALDEYQIQPQRELQQEKRLYVMSSGQDFETRM
jgi:hypothetical protein